MNKDRLTDLIEQWIDGVITAENLNELKAELRSNHDSLEYYVDLAQIHSLLKQGQSSQLPASNVVPMERIIHRQKRRNIRMALVAAAAVIVLSLLTMRLFFVEDVTRPEITFESSPGTQLSLTHREAGDAPRGAVVAVGSRLQISQGAVELTFASGVKSIVMAPADLTLHDHDDLYLNQGKAWFHVPPAAVGFKVTTKDLKIIDLGTQFGVLADSNHHDEVHVFKGKVEVTALHVRKESTTLIAGEARRIDPVGRLIDIPSETNRFVSKLPNSLPYLHWSFDQLDNNQLTVEGSHPDRYGLRSTLISPKEGARLEPGVSGDALSLDGNGSYVLTNWAGLEGGRPRTVSFWMQLPAQGLDKDRCSIVGWGDTSTDFARWQVMVKKMQRHREDSKMQLAFGDGHQKGSHDVKMSLEYGQWHHVVISYSGKPNDAGYYQEEVYIDGEPVAVEIVEGRKEPVDTSIITKGAKPLSIGVTLRRRTQKRHFFQGLIDELYIYEGYMSENQVKSLIEDQGGKHSRNPSLQK